MLDMVVQSVKQEVFGTVLYPTIEEKGANIYMNLATKHPFANANKRTALTCLGIFLERNGKLLDVDNNEAVEFTRRVVNEHLDQEIIVDWIKRNTVDI
ncbi:type II toxin-antitoxin system death-on-curing family toxin (plasmid) [Staphylococcus argenteus]|nr:type II toxin-antitoxin system death-on-curing family toxin [Staphylococcus argenteus]